MRNAVQKIHCAVQRIDDPAVRLVGTIDRTGLLHLEPIAGTRLGEFLEQGLFCAVIGGSHKIARALNGNLQVLNLAKIALQGFARLEGSGGHDIHQGRTDHISLWSSDISM